MKSNILIAPCGGGRIPRNGASAKNYHLALYLKSKQIPLTVVDTEAWRKKPWILLRLLWMILTNAKATYIVGTDSMSAYRLIRFFNLLPHKRNVIYWTIGGAVAQWMKMGKVKSKPYQIVRYFLVEGEAMKQTFFECGYENVIVVPNFKNINYIPKRDKCHHKDNDTVQFVFLSRIIPQKGCDLIFDAMQQLNEKGVFNFHTVFYGPIEPSYEKEFQKKLQMTANAKFGGFLNLHDTRGYDILADYDVMLFPTFWSGEGFPGIIIDAYISGLPVIASNWNLNKDIVVDGETGYIIPPHNAAALAHVMKQIIENKQILKEMSANCQKKAMAYNTKTVISDALLTTIGLIS